MLQDIMYNSNQNVSSTGGQQRIVNWILNCCLYRYLASTNKTTTDTHCKSKRLGFKHNNKRETVTLFKHNNVFIAIPKHNV